MVFYMRNSILLGSTIKKTTHMSCHASAQQDQDLPAGCFLAFSSSVPGPSLRPHGAPGNGIPHAPGAVTGVQG